MVIDKALIEDIKSSTNIVDVIGEVVSLNRAGRNYLGLCPFHKEKTPSFNVIEDRQFYHCFGCGKSGDVFKFLEEYRQVSFQESVKVLADRLGIAVTLDAPRQSQQQNSPNQAFYDLHEDALKFYHAVLMTTKIGEAARAYLYERGMTDDLLKTFQIGLAPDEPDYLYQSVSKKYDEEVLTESGLFNLSESNRLFDTFKNRIMFPLKNEFGKTIGFSGRVWTKEDIEKGQAKYKNTRATRIFNKSYELYHLDQAKSVIQKTHEVYLMEGFMDVIAAYRAGHVNAVASMGTALTPEHVNRLRKLTKKIVLTYDGDKAGQNAIAKSLELLSDFQVDIVKIPDNMDPDEYLQKTSEEALGKLLVESRISDVEFWIGQLKPANVDNLQAEIAYVEQIAKIIAKSPSVTAQNSYISKVADLLPDFDFFQVEQAVNNERLTMRNQQTAQLSAASNSAYESSASGFRGTVKLPSTPKITGLRRAENQLFHRMLNHPMILNDYRMREEFFFQTPELEELYHILKQDGQIDTVALSLLSQEVQTAYYQVLEEILPPETSLEEVQAIEERRNHFLREQDFRKQSKQIRESSNHGDVDAAVEALQMLIAQKRDME
ncbi:DNA primase [Streptococcus vestibularis]|uniref:DNA primase n=1 Tax=Streptococcus vestibularis TaxID=1343 RepID=UPI0026F1B36C|nr:DNA primase [Streptococcus vestibularis]